MLQLLSCTPASRIWKAKIPSIQGVKMIGKRDREVFIAQVTAEGEQPHLSSLGDWSILTAPSFGTTGGEQALPPLPVVFNYIAYSPSSMPGWGVSVFCGQIFDRAEAFTVESRSLPFAMPRTK